ncbi:hypothetical protein ABZ516_34470 [Streptomyces sp. NPDC019826]|uniref:hypothetical protein n=1 Tax=Streptomyces sp. NPDC019826 TaxID=3156667 RepID=UPI0033CF8687
MYDFPPDLRNTQLALHQTRAAYEQYSRTLPWSAGPAPSWEGDKRLHSDYRSAKADGPGYTDAQREEIARFRADLLGLSTTVATHPFRATLEQGEVVAGRMTLKHTHQAEAALEAG